jgi:hypothetical protein
MYDLEVQRLTVLQKRWRWRTQLSLRVGLRLFIEEKGGFESFDCPFDCEELALAGTWEDISGR